MIKVNKKVSVLLAIVMVLAVLPMTASAFSPSAEAAAEYEARWDAAGYTTAWAQISQWFPGTTTTGGPGAAPVDDVDDGDDNDEENGDVEPGEIVIDSKDATFGYSVKVSANLENAEKFQIFKDGTAVSSVQDLGLATTVYYANMDEGDSLVAKVLEADGTTLVEEKAFEL